MKEKINLLAISAGNTGGVALEIEEWKDVPGYNGYQASTFGNIKSFKQSKLGKVIKGWIGVKGYRYINLNNKEIQVHQVLSITFLNHTLDGTTKLVINHIDGNPLNNKLDNLEVVTHRENLSTCFRKNQDSFSSKFVGVSWNKRDSKWRAGIRIKGKSYNLGNYNSEEEAHQSYINKLNEINNG